MGILRYNFRSETLGMHTDVTITYPSGQYTCRAPVPGGQDRVFPQASRQYTPGMKLPTVYLLHGGGDDDTLLHRYTRLEYYADQAGVMTVTPRVNDSFFLDTAYGFDYFTYLTQELPVVVRALFASSDKREDNFAVGMAMGGSPALAVGLRCPDRFAACVDLSGGIGYTLDREEAVNQLREIPMPKLRCAFPPAEELPGSSADLWAIAKAAKESGAELPRLFLGVGEKDFIRHRVDHDHRLLEALGIPHHYEEAPGLGHEWDFWDLYLKKALLEWLPIQR